jgi:trigger factor
MCTLIGCGSSDSDSVISTGNTALKDAVYTNDWISLASYDGLTADKNVYEVTQDALDEGILSAISDYIEYSPVEDRPSAEGDWIYADYTASIDGDLYDEEEDYYFVIGEAEFGTEFDKQLTGISSGDVLNFSLSYDEDSENEDWVGKTVDFSVSVTSIEEEIIPECTDDFVQENLGYDSYDEFEAAIRQSIADEYEEESMEELKDDLIQQVIDASSVLQYSKEDYDAAYSDVEAFYSSYADMFGMELQDLYDIYGVTEDTLKEDALDALYRQLVVNAIQENEDISISEEEYQTGVTSYMEENDYTSEEDFLNDYGEDAIRNQLLEDAVLDLLVEKAQITEVPAIYEE